MAPVVNQGRPFLEQGVSSASPASAGAPTPGTVKLASEGLVKAYAKRRVVDGVDLEIQTGETLAILGPNGAGKSTLFRMLGLLEEPDAGSVLYEGRPVRPNDLAARRRMASVFQRPLLFQGSVAGNVAYGLKLRRTPRKETAQRVERGLELVGLSDFRDADVRGLSGGELQRVALARALVLDPEVLFLDEPTSNLDPSVRHRFRTDLRALIGRIDATVVLITHDQAEAMVLADKVAVMREGRIVQVGAPREVFTHPQSTFVAEFMGVETLWSGVVEEASFGLVTVRTAVGARVEAVSELPVGAAVAVAVRSEDVLLEVPGDGGPPFAATGASSARNRWPAEIESMELLGAVVRVRLAIAADGNRDELNALVTRRSAEELDLREGLALTAALKATAVHVIPADGGFGRPAGTEDSD